MKDNEKFLSIIGEIDEDLVPAVTEVKVRGGGSARKKAAIFGSVCAAALVLGFCSVGSVVAAGKLHKSVTAYYDELPDENYGDFLFDVNKVVTNHGYTVEVQNGFCDGYTLFLIVKEEITDSDAYWQNVYDEFRKDAEESIAEGRYHATMDVAVNADGEEDGMTELVGASHVELLAQTDHSVTKLWCFGNDTPTSFVYQYNQVVLCITDFSYDEATNSVGGIKIPIAIKVSDKKIITQYNLGEGFYRYDESIKIGDNSQQNYADVYLNPWLASITRPTVKGKRLDIDRSKDVPFVEITLKNGETYTEKNGIHVKYEWGGKDIDPDSFGKEYDLAMGIVMAFDKPIDVTAIQSFKINGVETRPVG